MGYLLWFTAILTTGVQGVIKNKFVFQHYFKQRFCKIAVKVFFFYA